MYLKNFIVVCLAFKALNLNAAATEGDGAKGSGSSPVSKAIAGDGAGTGPGEGEIKVRPVGKSNPLISLGAKASRALGGPSEGGAADTILERAGTISGTVLAHVSAETGEKG